MHQGGNVGHDADMATVGQRCGADIDGGAVGANPAAHLRPGDVVGHLLCEYGVGIAGAIFAGIGPPADHFGQRFTDLQRGALHHYTISVIEHGDAPVGTIDANPVRHIQQHQVQHPSSAASLVLSLSLGRDVVNRDGAAAVGQQIEYHIDRPSVGCAGDASSSGA